MISPIKGISEFHTVKNNYAKKAVKKVVDVNTNKPKGLTNTPLRALSEDEKNSLQRAAGAICGMSVLGVTLGLSS